MGNLPFGVEAFEYLKDAVVVINEESIILFINRSASNLFSVSQSELIGRHIDDLFIQEWPDFKDKKAFESSLNEKGSWFGKNQYYVKAKAHLFTAYTSITVFNDPSGRRRGLIYNINSVPEKNIAEEFSLSPDVEENFGDQELASIIDAEALQSMMNDLYAVTKIGFAIIDLKGNVLASAGWQDICIKFHRTNPQTLWNCLESDLVLTQGVVRGEFRTYKCKNNMWDIVTPIIVGNRHVGNLFSGQFFFDDEVIDRKLFTEQAEKYGFDKESYLAALDEVPRWNRAVVKNLMLFYVKLSEMISRLSYGNLKLSKALSDQRIIETELRRSHHDLNHAQGVAKTGSWRINVQKNELLWSDETYRMFGIPKGTPLNYERFLSVVYPEDRAAVDQAWQVALRGQPYDVIHRILVNGEVFWVHERAELEFADNGALTGGFGTVQDITEHKVDEQNLRRLNRAMRAISNANQVLMRATDEVAFLQQGCRIIIEDCGYALVWIGFAEQDEAKTVKPMAYAGFDQGYIDSLKITWADTERGQGPTGRAIRTGKIQICADIHTDPNFAIWKSMALSRGYVSSIVLPLLSEGKAFGALNIYSRESNPFSEDEVKLLAELASDFSHGIMLLRMQAAAKQAEEACRLSEERFSKAFNQSPAAISITCLSDGRYVDVNQTFLEMLGYSRGEVINHTAPELNIFTNPNASKEFLNIFGKGRSIHNVEMTFRTKSGNLLPTIVSIEKISIKNEDHIITTFIDITARKQAEEQLINAKEEWERTFDALPDLIAIIDKSHRILRVNKAMADRLGMRAEQCIGLPCYRCVHGTDVPPSFCPHDATLGDNKEHFAEAYEERLGGKVVITTTPILDKVGKVYASVHVVHMLNKLEK